MTTPGEGSGAAPANGNGIPPSPGVAAAAAAAAAGSSLSAASSASPGAAAAASSPSVSMEQRLLLAIQRREQQRALALILGGGIDLSACPDPAGNTFLSWACWVKMGAAVMLLLRREGVNVHTRNQKQQTALHWAAMAGNIPVLKMLVDAGADLGSADHDGYTAVHCAAQHGHTALLEYLMTRGADLHAVDNNRRTALHWAAYKDVPEAVEWLLQRGVQPALQDSIGRTAMHWAAAKSNVNSLAVLVDFLEKTNNHDWVNVEDAQGLTPYGVANSKECHAAAQLLLKRQMDVQAKLTGRKFYMAKNFATRFLLIEGGKFGSGMLRMGVLCVLWFYVVSAISIVHHAFYMAPYIPQNAIAPWQHSLALFSACVGYFLFMLTSMSDPGFVTPQLLASDDANRKRLMAAASPAGASGGDDNEAGDVEAALISPSAGDPENPNDISAAVRGRTVAQLHTVSELDGVLTQDRFLNYGQLLERGKTQSLCLTCRLPRPLRSKHCAHCDRCVSVMDHHCVWINNCVAEGNHHLFVLLLLALMIGMAQYARIAVVFMSYAGNRTMHNLIFAAPLCMHAIVWTIYCVMMSTQQLSLAAKNITVNERINQWRYEYLKDRSGQLSNPFDEGIIKNLLSFFRLRRSLDLTEMPLVGYASGRTFSADGAGAGGGKAVQGTPINLNGSGGHGHSHGGRPCHGHH